jgi:hypothetical protein
MQSRPGGSSGLTGAPIAAGMQVPVAGIYGLE